jgi:hypothetical protein
MKNNNTLTTQEYAYISEGKGLLGWENMVAWRDFRPPHISEVIQEAYIQHITFERFMWQF